MGARAAFLFAALTAFTFGCSREDTSTSRDALGPYAGHKLELFVGTASKPPTEEVVAMFEKRTGATLEVHFGGSGKMLSDMKLAERGDIYFPGSSDYMEKAKTEGLVVPETEARIVYLIPAINVSRGNPQNIQGLADLAKPGVRVGLARPDTVCVGLYGVESLERAHLAEQVKPNIVTNVESCEKTAQLVSLGSVDAVLGWDVFEHWDPEHIQTIYLPKDQVARIGYIPIAVAARAAEPALAKEFIAFLSSDEGKAMFAKWGYLTSEAEARTHATPTTPVGGVYELPASWQQ